MKYAPTVQKKEDTGDRFTLTDTRQGFISSKIPGCNLGISLHSINMGINCQYVAQRVQTKKCYARKI